MARQKFLTLLLALGLSATGAGETYAKSAPDVHFYPANAWTLDATEISSANDAPSCTIRNTFNNGFTIRMDGSHKWVESATIDFRQGIFENGKTYAATGAVPGLINKNLSATAISASTLRVDLQGHKDLYKAFRNSSVFDLDIEGNNFRFYLVGIADVSKNFERCMAGGGIAPPAPEAVANAMVNESVALEEAERQTKFDITAPPPARITNDKIILEDEQDSTMAAEPAPKRMSERIAAQIEQDPAIADMEEPVLKAEPIDAVAAAPITPMPGEMAEPVQAKVPTPMPVKMPQQQDLQISSTRKMTEEKFEDSEKINVTKESFEVEADFSEFGKVEPSSAGSHDRMDHDLVRKISQLEGIVQGLKKENDDLNSELNMALQEGKHEQVSISNENWNLERATMRFNEAELQLKRLGQQLNKERAQCDIEKKELETMLFDPQVTSQQQLARLAEMEERLMAAESELENQRSSYEERIRVLQSGQ